MRQLTARTCDALVRLPMRGAVESLNVSVASGSACTRRCASGTTRRTAARRVSEPATETDSWTANGKPSLWSSADTQKEHAMPVIEVRHPLVRHKVGLLREHGISTKKFRELTHELARLLTYEATADFPLEPATVECWSGPVEVERISGKKVTVVPILRAGIGMLEGVLDLIPSAKVSVVGLSRNHETLQPENYFEQLRRPTSTNAPRSSSTRCSRPPAR